MNSNTRIYFIQVVDGGPIKIGCSEHPEKRLTTLMSWCPYELQLIAHVDGCPISEATLHQMFKASNLRGEWFSPTEDLLSFIETVKAAGRLPEGVTNTVMAHPHGIRRNTTRVRHVLKKHGMTLKQLASGMGIPVGTAAHFTSMLPEYRAVQVASYLTSIGIPTQPMDLYGDEPDHAPLHKRRPRKSHPHHGAAA